MLALNLKPDLPSHRLDSMVYDLNGDLRYTFICWSGHKIKRSGTRHLLMDHAQHCIMGRFDIVKIVSKDIQAILHDHSHVGHSESHIIAKGGYEFAYVIDNKTINRIVCTIDDDKGITHSAKIASAVGVGTDFAIVSDHWTTPSKQVHFGYIHDLSLIWFEEGFDVRIATPIISPNKDYGGFYCRDGLFVYDMC